MCSANLAKGMCWWVGDGAWAAVQVEKLIDDGYDVRGYFYWTLIDNFEVWAL